MLHAVSVENYRSFADNATVELRPLTVLLGRNSAGKSSLTRLFPLLRQSMERGTSAPILWNSSSVDFGKIADVINRQHPKLPVQISFELSGERLEGVGSRSRHNPLGHELSQDLTSDFKFTAFLRAGNDGKTHYQRLAIEIDNKDLVELNFKNSDVTIAINNRQLKTTTFWSRIISPSARLFPFIYFEDEKGENISETPNTRSALLTCLSKIIDLPDGKNVNELRFLRQDPLIDPHSSSIMPFVSRSNLHNFLTRSQGFKEFNKYNTPLIDELSELLILTYIAPIILHIGSGVTSAMQNLSYLGPIRASGNRFYREQELSVDKIDDTGENLATYLGSLSKVELKGFNEILRKSFGVEVRAHSESGHLSIEIGRPGDENYDNLADVGFGFSQVLPLVAQIHSESKRHSMPPAAAPQYGTNICGRATRVTPPSRVPSESSRLICWFYKCRKVARRYSYRHLRNTQ